MAFFSFFSITGFKQTIQEKDLELTDVTNGCISVMS